MRIVAPFFVAVAIGLAAPAAHADDLSIAASLGFKSRYVFRGVQYAETSLQPAVTLTKDDFHVGAWFNLPVGDDDNVAPANGEELDLVVGYSTPLGAIVTLDVGLTHYLFPEAMSGFGDFCEEDGDGLGINTLEPYASLSFAVPLTPTIVLYRDFMYDTFTVQGTVSHSIPIADKTSFDLSGYVGYVIDDSIGTDYLYGVASAGLSDQFSETSKVYAGARYGGSDLPGGSLVGDSIAGTTQPSGFWWGIGLSTSFSSAFETGPIAADRRRRLYATPRCRDNRGMDGTFDIIVIGGGLSGGLAATALAREGFAVALVDAENPAAMLAGAFDGRTTAIAYASARVFRRLDLWPAIENDAEPIRDILVTDGRRESPGRKGLVSSFHLHFDSRELDDGEPLGFIVENRVLRHALYAGLAREERVTQFAPAQRLRTEFGKARALVTLADGRVLAASLIFAADGRQSPLRAEAAIKTNQWSYDQVGLVATVAHERAHLGVAQELFLPSGPFAILPMTGDRSSLVWTEAKAAAPAYLALPDAAFLAAIRARFGDYLGDIRLAGPRWSYPLAFHLAQTTIAPRLALIGDAAHAIHPIAGQGYNLAVKDIAALAEVLADARAVGLDIGALATLEKYQRWRRFDSAMLAFGTDALNRLFSNDIALLRLARDAGMGAVNAIAPLRRFFMKQAGADLGRLPALMAR